MSDVDPILLADPSPDLRQRSRELEALFETAGDLAALHEVDEVLTAIVRRARALLATDVAYLLLLDEESQTLTMRVSEGIQSSEFMAIRLAVGEGIAGDIARSGMPAWTEDYRHDAHLARRIDDVVRRESLVAMLGVPLVVRGRLLGVLLASDRQARVFDHREVALLTSLGRHAAIALENASLLEAHRSALERLEEASARLEEQNHLLERSAALHDELMGLVLAGEGVQKLARALESAIGGQVVVLDARDVALTRSPSWPDGEEGATECRVEVHAGRRLLGYLVHQGDALRASDRRALERAALVTALLLLDHRVDWEARARMVGDLMLEIGTRGEPGRARLRQAAAAGVRVPAAPYVVMSGLLSSADASAEMTDDVLRIALVEGWLARYEEGRISILVHGGDPAAEVRQVRDQLGQALPAAVTLGAVGPFMALADAPAALERAVTCARVLETTGRVGGVATPEDLGVYTLLLGDAGRVRVEEFVQTTLGTVLARDEQRSGDLIATLEAYFDLGGQGKRLADALFIHVNTLYQRLERLDRLLGKDWRRGESALQIHLALRLHRLAQGV